MRRHAWVHMLGKTLRYTVCCSALALVASAPSAGQQVGAEAAGNWVGTVEVEGWSLALSVVLEGAASGWAGTVSIPSQYALAYALGEVRVTASEVIFELPEGLPPGRFRGVVSSDRLQGEFTSALGPDTLRGVADLRRRAAESPPYATHAVRFGSGEFQLAGTLYRPVAGGPHPGVVLVHGSGPQTRESYLRWFADAFARAGFVALIYDKRGTGESSGARWPNTPGSFTDLADDALAAVQVLRAEYDVDPARVGVWGLSQGAWIAPLVAARARPEARFVVLISGGGVSPADQELYDDEARLRRLGFEDSDIGAALSYLRLADRYVRTGTDADWERFAQAREAARREPWYGHLDQFPQILPREAPVWSGLRTDLDYDPAGTLSAMKQPTLVILGEVDELTPARTTASRIEESFRVSGNPGLSVHVLAGADHALMVRPTPTAPWVAHQPALGWVDAMLAWFETIW